MPAGAPVDSEHKSISVLLIPTSQFADQLLGTNMYGTILAGSAYTKMVHTTAKSEKMDNPLSYKLVDMYTPAVIASAVTSAHQQI